MIRLPTRPLPAAIGIGLAAEALFAFRVTTPHKLVFDEIHYVGAARVMRTLSHATNIEHPLTGKMLIAAGMTIFGDDALGWRAFSTIAGTAVVVGVFAILWLLFGRLRTAAFGAVLATLNFTVFVQARIAMLDGFMAAFVVTGLATMLWAMRGSGGQVWRRWILGSVLLGLAVGTKWTAVPYLAMVAAGFVIGKARDRRAWPGMGMPAGLLLLGLVAGATYLATFAPAFFYADDPMTIGQLIPFQKTIYAEQTQILPAHTYQSAWWTWPLLIRPIWYLYEIADGAERGILMLGNPAIMWGGLIAVMACLWGWWRGADHRLGAVALLWIGSVAMWAIIPKSLGFYYYYYLSSIWLPVAIAAAFDRFGRDRLRYWDEGFLVLSLGLFVYFYPIIAAAPLAGPMTFHRWMWFARWV